MKRLLTILAVLLVLGTATVMAESAGQGLEPTSCGYDSLHTCPIPEFSFIAAGVAVAGAGVGFLALRRRR